MNGALSGMNRWLTAAFVALMIGAIILGVKVGCSEAEKSAAAPARTNAPLLITKAKPPEVPLVEYPFKQRVVLDGFILGTLHTNVTEEAPTNGEIFRVVTVTAKMVIQAPWENMILQWNYDKPVDATTNRYKLVR